MNEGRKEWLFRSTTTSNDPLAASKRLSWLIDFSTTGWLRSVVVSPNGFRSVGSRCTADSTRASTTSPTKTAAIAPSLPSTEPCFFSTTVVCSRGSSPLTSGVTLRERWVIVYLTPSRLTVGPCRARICLCPGITEVCSGWAGEGTAEPGASARCASRVARGGGVLQSQQSD